MVLSSQEVSQGLFPGSPEQQSDETGINTPPQGPALCVRHNIHVRGPRTPGWTRRAERPSHAGPPSTILFPTGRSARSLVRPCTPNLPHRCRSWYYRDALRHSTHGVRYRRPFVRLGWVPNAFALFFVRCRSIVCVCLCSWASLSPWVRYPEPADIP